MTEISYDPRGPQGYISEDVPVKPSSPDSAEVRAFERWLPDHLMPSEFSHSYLFKRDSDGDYEIDFVRTFWEGWIGHRDNARSSAGSVEPDELEALIADRSASRAADAILKEFVVTHRGGDLAQASAGSAEAALREIAAIGSKITDPKNTYGIQMTNIAQSALSDGPADYPAQQAPACKHPNKFGSGTVSADGSGSLKWYCQACGASGNDKWGPSLPSTESK